MKLLHLLPDEKVTPFVQRMYETAFPGENVFRIAGPRTSGEFRYAIKCGDVRVARPAYFFSRELRADAHRADCVVIHYMNKWFARAADVAPERTKVVWSGWGLDYQILIPAYRDNRFLPRTAQALSKRVAERGGLSLKGTIFYLQKAVEGVLFAGWVRRMSRRIDLVFVLPGEFEPLRGALPLLSASLCELNYYSVEEVFAKGSERMHGPDILVGNSTDPMNNHLDAFEVLYKIDLAGRKIIVPLNYGNNEVYARAVIREGRRLFGSAFVPITSFLPLEEYNRVLGTCGTVIMNHRCQQAIGNIATSLFKGATVFLRTENPVYEYFRGMGCDLKTIPSVDSVDACGLDMISEGARQSNRLAICRHWTNEKVVERIRRILVAPNNEKP